MVKEGEIIGVSFEHPTLGKGFIPTKEGDTNFDKGGLNLSLVEFTITNSLGQQKNFRRFMSERDFMNLIKDLKTK